MVIYLTHIPVSGGISVRPVRQGTYGSPCGAWAHEQATGWY
jgi:hypothetical protein